MASLKCTGSRVLSKVEFNSVDSYIMTVFTWCGVFYDVADERNFDVAYFRFVFYSKTYIGAKNCAAKTGSSRR